MSSGRIRRWRSRSARGHVAQGRDRAEIGAQEPHAFLAGLAPGVVFAARVLVAHVGIGDQQPQVRRDRDVARFERAAVDQERIAGDAAGRDILVHDAAAHADIVVLRPLADFCDFDRLERQSGGGHERMRDAHFERGRGAQARAERHVGEDDEIGAAEAPPALLQHHGDAEHIVRPLVPAARRRGVEVERARLVHDHRIDAEPPVRPRRGGDEGGEFERRRHDEAVVVVGVLADQVHPPRRAADFRHAAEAAAEFLRCVARQDAHLRPRP